VHVDIRFSVSIDLNSRRCGSDGSASRSRCRVQFEPRGRPLDGWGGRTAKRRNNGPRQRSSRSCKISACTSGSPKGSHALCSPAVEPRCSPGSLPPRKEVTWAWIRFKIVAQSVGVVGSSFATLSSVSACCMNAASSSERFTSSGTSQSANVLILRHENKGRHAEGCSQAGADARAEARRAEGSDSC
jgi:hypothetical protein